MLGVKVSFVNVNSADRVPFVVADKVDIVMGAITRTPERAKVIDFTVPIMTEALSVLTFKTQPFKTWHDLDSPSVTLSQVRGTTPVTSSRSNLPHAKVLLLDNFSGRDPRPRPGARPGDDRCHRISRFVP